MKGMDVCNYIMMHTTNTNIVLYSIIIEYNTLKCYLLQLIYVIYVFLFRINNIYSISINVYVCVN
jgi:hypothetical protein